VQQHQRRVLAGVVAEVQAAARGRHHPGDGACGRRTGRCHHTLLCGCACATCSGPASPW
jgi:hypothetical protein